MNFQKTKKIMLQHHVYTSLDGYQTVYASPKLSKAIVTELEEISDSLCRSSSVFKRPSQFVLGDFLCFSSVSELGADHAGRRRLCAHTTLFSKNDLASIPGASLLLARERDFAKSWHSLDHLIRSLSPSFSSRKLILKDVRPYFKDFQFPSEKISAGLFSAFLSNKKSTVVIGKTEMALYWISRIVLSVPRLTRLSNSLLVGSVLPKGSLDGERKVYVVEDGEIEDYIQQGFLVIDLRNKLCHNLPDISKFPYVKFLLNFVNTDASRRESLVRLLSFQEKDPAFDLRSVEGDRHYVRALQLIEPFLDGKGDLLSRFVAGKSKGHLRLLITAAVEFYRAESRNKSLEILNYVLRAFLRDSGDVKKARKLLEEELVLWADNLNHEEADSFMRSIGMFLNESGEFDVSRKPVFDMLEFLG